MAQDKKIQPQLTPAQLQQLQQVQRAQLAQADAAKAAAAKTTQVRETIPSTETPPQAGQKIHVVTAGDTLWGIAQKEKIPLDVLAAANNLADPKFLHPTKQNGNIVIRPGDKLVIPPPVQGRGFSAADAMTFLGMLESARRGQMGDGMDAPVAPQGKQPPAQAPAADGVKESQGSEEAKAAQAKQEIEAAKAGAINAHREALDAKGNVQLMQAALSAAPFDRNSLSEELKAGLSGLDVYRAQLDRGEFKAEGERAEVENAIKNLVGQIRPGLLKAGATPEQVMSLYGEKLLGPQIQQEGERFETESNKRGDLLRGLSAKDPAAFKQAEIEIAASNLEYSLTEAIDRQSKTVDDAVASLKVDLKKLAPDVGGGALQSLIESAALDAAATSVKDAEGIAKRDGILNALAKVREELNLGSAQTIDGVPPSEPVTRIAKEVNRLSQGVDSARSNVANLKAAPTAEKIDLSKLSAELQAEVKSLQENLARKYSDEYKALASDAPKLKELAMQVKRSEGLLLKGGLSLPQLYALRGNQRVAEELEQYQKELPALEAQHARMNALLKTANPSIHQRFHEQELGAFIYPRLDRFLKGGDMSADLEKIRRKLDEKTAVIGPEKVYQSLSKLSAAWASMDDKLTAEMSRENWEATKRFLEETLRSLAPKPTETIPAAT